MFGKKKKKDAENKQIGNLNYFSYFWEIDFSPFHKPIRTLKIILFYFIWDRTLKRITYPMCCAHPELVKLS